MTIAALFGAALVPASSAAQAPPAAPAPIFHRANPFVGVVAGNGIGFVPDRSRVHPFPILRFAFKTGIFLGRTELGVEAAPFSQLYALGPTLNAQAYAGYHVPLSKELSWPMRAGLGFTLWIGIPLPQARVDVLGLSMQSGRWLIDLQLPSLRLDRIPAKGHEKANYWPSMVFSAGFAFAP
jgi:hypothetical protein